VVETWCRAGADDVLARLVVEAVLALELAGDCRLELRDAVDRGVLRRLAALDRRDRSPLDVVGRVEIRLPRPEPDHITAGRLDGTRPVREREGRGRLDALEVFRQEGHDDLRLPVPGASFLMTQ